MARRTQISEEEITQAKQLRATAVSIALVSQGAVGHLGS